MKTSVRFIALIIAITATFVTQTVRAQEQTLVMTEQSSSVLDVIFDGIDITATGVINTSADHWTITLPLGINSFAGESLDWAEPENPGLGNIPTGWNVLTSVDSTHLTVVSDTSAGNSIILEPNSVSASFNGTSFVINDVSDGAVTTPDTGSTLGLLALALAALFGASRFRALRLA